MTELSHLKSSWENLLQKFSIDPVLQEQVFFEVARLYSSSDRFYHNLDHVRQVLEVIATQRAIARNLDAIEFAAWFHDIIYDPKAKDNEEKSAEYAASLLRSLDIPTEIIYTVKNLIIKTKTHHNPDSDIDSQILLDADLSILGSDEAEYRSYSEAIRREYSWISDDSYRLGRQQFLYKVWHRQKIYLTDTIFAALEIEARRNIQAELQSLSSV